MKNILLKVVFLTLVSALLIEAGVLPNSASRSVGPKERKGFRLLGTVKKSKSVSKFGIRSTIYEDWDYWESANSAGWAEAKRDCVANGDTLLYIETIEEVANVTRWLQDTDNTGVLYWTGGKYDVRTEQFLWDNGDPISPDAPWGAGQPKDKKPNTRVAITTIGREIEYKTQPATTTSRYICEGERVDDGDQEQIPIPCFKDNDLVIVIDSSGSIGDASYEVAKEFTTRLATTWVDHIGSRVSVLIYSNDATTIMGLTDDQTVDSIKQKVYNMPHLGGGANSHLGIDLAFQEFQANARNVPQNMVFLTDGQSNSECLTKASADRAKRFGIRAFSVGIGSGIGQAELLAIAGGVSDHVFSTTQFDELLVILRPLSIKLCE